LVFQNRSTTFFEWNDYEPDILIVESLEDLLKFRSSNIGRCRKDAWIGRVIEGKYP
jgi:hypothetical protein